jgi:subtilisin family serine protease
VLSGWNVIAGNTDTADDNGHGTAVAGVIAAVTGNGTGIASYCWRCLILPVKVLDAHGVGDTGNVATGIRWAADHGARVINVSLGTLVDDSRLRDAVTYARSKGALVVAAAGNLGLPRFEFPAADPGALAVGGIDPTGALASWSANGPWVQLAAPGTNISTARGGGYAPFAGTSSAAPVVSGIAAEALSAVPRATADQLTQALEQTAHATAGVEYGRVDAGALVTALSASVVPTVVRTTASARVARAAR